MSCSGDNFVKIWDLNAPQSVTTIPAHPNEVLAVDWSKYNEFQVASGSVDQTIKIWDLRNIGMPMTTLRGHTYAIRRLKFSPHQPDLLGSVSYDMTCCLWNTQVEDAMLQRCQHHSEFVLGIVFPNSECIALIVSPPLLQA